jgi:arylsulfatase A-like enzyme
MLGVLDLTIEKSLVSHGVELWLLWTSLYSMRTKPRKMEVSLTSTDNSSILTRPNILCIFSDQQHWRALGHQDDFFETPTLDCLVEEGTWFERAFCTTPQCSPSRSSMFTGFYPSTTGVMGNIGAYGGAPLAMPTVATTLRRLGYRTGYFGKWHLGHDPTGMAGWDASFGVRQTSRPADSVTTQNALTFLTEQRKRDSPFALFLSYNDPHDIYDFDPDEFIPSDDAKLSLSWQDQAFERVPGVQAQFMTEDQGRRLYGRDRETWKAYHAFYREKVRLYDAHVGRVLDALSDAGMSDHTVVVATSDHGDMDASHRLIFKGPFMYDEMIRIPLIVRVPDAFGGSAGRSVDDRDVTNTDLVPTLVELAGGTPLACDGISLAPMLTGTGDVPRRDYVVAQYHGKQRWVNPIRTIRTSAYKYNRYLHHGEELYDLRNDPRELVNLASDLGYRDVKRTLRSELDAWIRTHDDPFESLTVTDRAGRPLGNPSQRMESSDA